MRSKFCEPIVFSQRQSHGPRRSRRRHGKFCSRVSRLPGYTAGQNYEKYDCAFHRSPLFLSRWKSSSTTGVWLSLVNSDFKKMDGPKCGNATGKGRLRAGVVAGLTVCSFETSCFAASTLASVCVELFE